MFPLHAMDSLCYPLSRIHTNATSFWAPSSPRKPVFFFLVTLFLWMISNDAHFTLQIPHCLILKVKASLTRVIQFTSQIVWAPLLAVFSSYSCRSSLEGTCAANRKVTGLPHLALEVRLSFAATPHLLGIECLCHMLALVDGLTKSYTNPHPPNQPYCLQTSLLFH